MNWLEGFIKKRKNLTESDANFHTQPEHYLPYLLWSIEGKFPEYKAIKFKDGFENSINELVNQYDGYKIITPFHGIPTAVDQIDILFPQLNFLPAEIIGIDLRAHEYIDLFRKYRGFGTNRFSYIDDSNPDFVRMEYQDSNIPMILHRADSLNFLRYKDRSTLLGDDRVGMVTILSGIEPVNKRDIAPEASYLQSIFDVITAMSLPGDLIILNQPLWPYRMLNLDKNRYNYVSATEHNELLIRI